MRKYMSDKLPKGRPYVVVSGGNADELERNIYQQIAEGYKLYGPTFMWGDRACQAVVKGPPKKLLFK
jgi:hypothetical protein